MIRSRLSMLTVCVVLAAAGLSCAAEDEGWIVLFNGKDLSAWTISDKGDWKIENGELITPPQRSHLFTKQEFVNFHFKAEIKTAPKSNSGVYFHTKFEEGNWPSTGVESQVNNTHPDPVKTGSIYYRVKVYESPAKDNEWWLHEVIVKGKNVQVKVNGKIITDYTEPEGSTDPHRFGKGSMALQAHDPESVVRYRNISIKPLP